MLVTFRSKAAGDVMMFGDVAIQLLKFMGNSGTVPGAIVAKDLPKAIERLEAAITTHEATPTANPETKREDDDTETNSVSLRHRALPLINLLKASAAADADVVWDK